MPKYDRNAIMWCRKYAQQGNSQAQYCLGMMYEKGESICHDLELAHMWFSLASSKGHADAVKQIQELESKMTLSEIKEAKESARNWKPLE
jgi:TPR repeat protein